MILPINPLNGFKSIYSHHPSGNKHGGVASFYKEILPLFERNDCSFDPMHCHGNPYWKEKGFLYCYM